MTKKVSVKGFCPAMNREHTVTANYLSADDLSHRDVWILGRIECDKSHLFSQSICDACPIMQHIRKGNG